MAAKTAAAGLVVAVLYQIGTVSAGFLPRGVAVMTCIAGAVAAIAVDVRAIYLSTYSVGLRRQTAKNLGHDPARPWWVTPLFWGLDTGLVWSTFRVSCTSWVLLIAALLNVAPQWSGLVYGAFFGVPLLVAVSTRAPDMFETSVGRTRQLVQAAGIVFLATLPLGVVVNGSLPA